MRSPLFSQSLFRDLVLQHGFGQQALEATILGFQLLEPLGIRDRHAAELAAPQVVARFREAMPAAQLCHWQP